MSTRRARKPKAAPVSVLTKHEQRALDYLRELAEDGEDALEAMIDEILWPGAAACVLPALVAAGHVETWEEDGATIWGLKTADDPPVVASAIAKLDDAIRQPPWGAPSPRRG